MMDIKEIRKQYPEYNSWSDDRLRKAIERKQAAESGGISDEDLIRKASRGIMSSLISPDMKSAIAGGEGFLTGIKDIGRGVKQLGKGAAELVGISPKGSQDEYTKEVDRIRQQEAQNIAESFPNEELSYGAGKFAGEAAPFALIPGGQGGIAAKIIQGALTGGGIGASQYVPEGESRLQNSLIGTLAGAGIPAVGAALTSAPVKLAVSGVKNLAEKAGKYLFPNQFESLIAKDLMTGIDKKTALKAKKDAEKIGLQLTPGQASGSESVISAERTLGRSKKGKEKLEEFSRKQAEQGEKVTRETLDSISKGRDDASYSIRDAAKGVIDREREIRKKISEPYYEAAKSDLIPKKELTNLLKQDSLVKRAYSTVLKDPAYGNALKGIPRNSVEFANITKKYMGEKINEIMSGLPLVGNRNEAYKAKIYEKSKKKLDDLIDSSSENYKTAKQLFSKHSAKLNKLEKSTLRNIAELPDDKLKKVSGMIFDQSSFGKKEFGELRDNFVKKDPKGWLKITRNHMEDLISHTKDSKSLPNFYKAILEKDASFNQIMSAMKGMPEAQKRLIYTRNAAKNLYKLSRDKALESTEKATHGFTTELYRSIKDAFTKEHDKKAVEIMTSPDWDKYLVEIAKTKDKFEKAKKFLTLLNMPAQRTAVVAATSPKEAKK